MNAVKSWSFFAAALLLATSFLMGCSTNEGAKLATITVSPATQSMANGTTLQFTAVGTFTDGSVVNYTPEVRWYSSNESIATISNVSPKGIVASYATGTTMITAVEPIKGLMSTNAAVLRVDDHGTITITPVGPWMAVGKTHSFKATATFDDGTQQNLTSHTAWSTSDSLVASVSNIAGTTGLVTAGTITGTAIISASSGTLFVSSVTGTTLLNVTATPLTSLAITQVAPVISLGTTTQFTAVGTFQDGTKTPELTASWVWTSSNTLVSTIGSTDGLVTSGTITGTTTIKATDPITNVSGSATLKVE